MAALVIQHCSEAAPSAGGPDADVLEGEGLMLMSMKGTSVPEFAHFNSSMSG